MRNCGDCQVCCKGYLAGTTRGSWFGNLQPCKYLKDTCTIYNDRPSQCRNYQCAWFQGILPEWMKPSSIGVLVSVELDKANKQYLKAVYVDNIPGDVENELVTFVEKEYTYLIKTKVIPIKGG